MTPCKKLLIAGLPGVAIVASMVAGVAAQAQGPGPAQFEVASVKPNLNGGAKVSIQTLPNGRFTAANVTLRMLITSAYRLQDFQVSGGPKWLGDDRFDIVAKAEGPGDPFAADGSGPPSRGMLMLRALLAERFHLETHTESRDLPIFALVAARGDGRLGPQISASSLGCSAPSTDQKNAAAAKGVAGPPQCGLRQFPGNVIAGGTTLAQLAGALAPLVGRQVIDRTSRGGAFDYKLTWTPDELPAPGYDRKAAALGLPPVDANGPSLFTALQEQLGLKLESQRGPVDVLIIDRAEHPRPD